MKKTFILFWTNKWGGIDSGGTHHTPSDTKNKWTISLKLLDSCLISELGIINGLKLLFWDNFLFFIDEVENMKNKREKNTFANSCPLWLKFSICSFCNNSTATHLNFSREILL